MTAEKLMDLAREAMTHAYAPYSGYQVGAALLSMTESGTLFPLPSAAARRASSPAFSRPAAFAAR